MQNGLTGLMVACLLGQVDIVKALLEARADTDMKEKVLLAYAYLYPQVHIMTNIIVWYHAVV